jgi:ribosomal protein S18 acetylase RimI-like enzyme
MDAETGAMYEPMRAGFSAEVQAGIDTVLTVDPSTIEVTVIAFDGDAPIGHSALRPFGDEFEVKKVYTDPAARGLGVAKALLAWLEQYAISHGAASLVLQTGVLQTEAIGLYEAIGYRRIPAFRGYEAIPGGVCMRKVLGA